MGKLKKWKKAERKKAELERWRKTAAPQPVGAFDRELRKGGALEVLTTPGTASRVLR